MPPAGDATSENGGTGGSLFEDKKVQHLDLRLVRRAIVNGWNVPAEIKQAVVDEVSLIAMASPDDRNKIAAARVLIAADGADLRLQMAAEKPEPASPSVQVQVNVVQNQVREALNHPEYLEFLERRALAEDRDTGPVRQVSGPVQDGTPSGADQPILGASK